MEAQDIKNNYISLKESNEALLAKLKKRSFLLSMLRLVVFLGGGILSAVAFSYSVTGGIATIIVTLSVFLVLLREFASCSGKISFIGNLVRINENELRALDGDFSVFDGGSEMIDPNHDFSYDTDLFGPDSLFQYLNRTITGPGRRLLAAWLLRPYDLRWKIPERQEAVRELAGKLNWRQHFMAGGLDRPLDEKDIDSLGNWLNDSEVGLLSTALKFSSRILPSAAILVLILAITGFFPPTAFVLLFLLNLFVIGINLKNTNRIHSVVSQKHNFLSSAGQLISSFEKEQFCSSVLKGIQEKIWTEQGSAAKKIEELGRIIKSFDNRLNLFVGFLLNGLLLWDFHCIMKLERWKKASAGRLPEWLNLLGEIDGLNSLANFTFNNPDYCFPCLSNEMPVIETSGMGHPLLKRETRVSNDFIVGRRGHVIIITGANMAGKSTFLRTVAVNIILAMTGAPVCAGEMIFSPVRLFTSMRTTDSLSHNESYFYAELKRLKILKERLENDSNIFFILDEILKGTNSTDKSTGSKLFLKRLIEIGGTGMIATHDISLGEMEKEFPGNVVNKCFEIEIDGEKISFDYVLRDGITRKMNASVLMKQMGIL
jgi:hypothetical protein